MINIHITPESAALAKDLQSGEKLMQAIARAIAQENELTLSAIKAKRLTGQGPFPVDEHRLGKRTGQLFSLAAASPPVITGTRVVSSLGDSVKYAAIHEFGGVIHHPARAMQIRHRIDALGNLVRQENHPNLARFAKASHKRVKEQTVQAEAYDVTIPARSVFQTGISERIKDYQESIAKAADAAMGGAK